MPVQRVAALEQPGRLRAARPRRRSGARRARLLVGRSPRGRAAGGRRPARRDRRGRRRARDDGVEDAALAWVVGPLARGDLARVEDESVVVRRALVTLDRCLQMYKTGQIPSCVARVGSRTHIALGAGSDNVVCGGRESAGQLSLDRSSERTRNAQPTVLPHPWQLIELVRHSQVRSTCSSSPPHAASRGSNVSELLGAASVEKRTMCGLRRRTACARAGVHNGQLSHRVTTRKGSRNGSERRSRRTHPHAAVGQERVARRTADVVHSVDRRRRLGLPWRRRTERTWRREVRRRRLLARDCQRTSVEVFVLAVRPLDRQRRGRRRRRGGGLRWPRGEVGRGRVKVHRLGGSRRGGGLGGARRGLWRVEDVAVHRARVQHGDGSVGEARITHRDREDARKGEGAREAGRGRARGTGRERERGGWEGVSPRVCGVQLELCAGCVLVQQAGVRGRGAFQVRGGRSSRRRSDEVARSVESSRSPECRRRGNSDSNL